MNLLKLGWPLIVIAAAFFLAGCNRMGNTENKDFYADSRRGDLLRIPLIQPYEAVSTDGKEWMINLLGTEITDELTISEIDSLGVYSEQVLVHTRADRFFAKHPFYLIDATQKQEQAFDHLPDAVTALGSATFKEFKMHPVQEVFERFDTGGPLPWPSK